MVPASNNQHKDNIAKRGTVVILPFIVRREFAPALRSIPPEIPPRWFSDSTDTVRAAIHDRTKSKLSYTRTLRAELTGSCVKALQEPGIEEDADNVVSELTPVL